MGYKIGSNMIAPMILALCCGIAITNLLSSFSKHPVIFSARFLKFRCCWDPSIALALSLVGHPMPNIMSATVQGTLPMAWFDGRVFDAASPAFSAILLKLFHRLMTRLLTSMWIVRWSIVKIN